MFSEIIEPCETFICTITMCWRSLLWLSLSPGPIFSNCVCKTLCWPSQSTPANVLFCSFYSLNFLVNTTWFAALRFRPVLPTLGVVRNTEEFHGSWKLSCISVYSLFPISVFKWNISTWSPNYLDSHHFQSSIWPGGGHTSSSICGRGTLGDAFLILFCSWWNTSHERSSWLGWGCSTGWLRTKSRNGSLHLQTIRESTKQSSVHYSYHCLDSSLQSSVPPSTNEQHTGCHLWTFCTPTETCKADPSTCVICFAYSSSVH